MTERADRQALVEKLRRLVRHPATEPAVREVAKRKLDLLAPRRAVAPSGSPRRRAADARQEVAADLLDAVERGAGGGYGADAGQSQRAARQRRHILDILA
jgi:DNA polymerase III epsilon subunit-like protein